MHYCLYYQAYVVPELCWQLTAFLRSHEHVSFDRTIDVEKSIFEFFVPHATDHHFREIMSVLEARGIIKDLVQLPNRIEFSTSFE